MKKWEQLQLTLDNLREKAIIRLKHTFVPDNESSSNWM